MSLCAERRGKRRDLGAVMKYIIRTAVLLAYAAACSLPLPASAQTVAQAAPAPMPGHRHQDPFMRALHTLTNGTPDQRKANRDQLPRQIIGVLTPEQLNAELAK